MCFFERQSRHVFFREAWHKVAIMVSRNEKQCSVLPTHKEILKEGGGDCRRLANFGF